MWQHKAFWVGMQKLKYSGAEMFTSSSTLFHFITALSLSAQDSISMALLNLVASSLHCRNAQNLSGSVTRMVLFNDWANPRHLPVKTFVCQFLSCFDLMSYWKWNSSLYSRFQKRPEVFLLTVTSVWGRSLFPVLQKSEFHLMKKSPKD